MRGTVLLVCAAAGLAAQALPGIETLRRGHPRLIALDEDIARIRELTRRDPLAATLLARLRESAARLESTAPVEYRLVGPRLLSQSRAALERIYTLALLYRLDGERRYLDRALKELRAAAAFPDWNPSHFLDTAEMTHAFAIGYDWLYPALQPEERELLRNAIVRKGLDPALGIYENRRSWTLAVHNWNQVCNGGISLGALAVAEVEPARAASIIRYAAESLPRAMNSYAPDGGWNEGPGYWHYATRYTAYFLAGLETSLGTGFGLSKAPGFDRAGHFRLFFASPTEKTFNYADSSDALEPAEEMFYLARRFAQPVYAWQQATLLARRNRAHALDLVWYRPERQTPVEAGLPLDAVFEGIQTAFLRSSWTDPEAIWAAIKGGDNRANHSHLDLGSFVLDSGATRWALDLGVDDYNLPAYFGNLRWTYYRLRTESHNTVLVNGQNQDPAAKAPVIARNLGGASPSVTIDLAAAYPAVLRSHRRTLTLAERKRVVVRDEITAVEPAELLWGMLTAARVTVDGPRALLRQDGRDLAATIASPAGARFEVLGAQPPAPQRQNEGVSKLVVRLPAKTAAAFIEVTLEPRKPGSS